MKNYIFPFLWMRDQSEEILREELDKIDACGIKAVCLESRPHPDFGGPRWWHDFDIVLDEAKKRDMKIWILDDAHFPTGQANGIIPKKYPERARKYIMMQHTDCTGPIVHASLDINLMMTKKFTWLDFGKPQNKPLIDRSKLISVTAIKIIDADVLDNTCLNLTESVKDGMLYWNVPEGVWRICVTFETYDFGARNEYINYIDSASVDALIESIYELHYEHYKDEFGKTIVGFFSDEPGFYNVDNFDMGDAIGRKKMALPWSDEMDALLCEALGNTWQTRLPYLWMDAKDFRESAYLRYCYMDAVSRLYAKNFSGKIGKWCEAHGVEYIGHVIEDIDQHSRLGCGAGHYFRAMCGQHMAGIDTIGGQILPGNPYGARHGVAFIADGHFYHFTLAKLGASAAQTDPKKSGRLMCEAFGAYGWNFGVRNMKWLVDFLLINGVNHFVPHAFSMADYPDDDCPPHFYARGNNPEFPYFAELMKYTNRMCELFNGGKNVPVVAVLYPAEHDWMSECMRLQTPNQELIEHQIDFEILPVDALTNKEYYGTKIENQNLIVNERVMKALIVPESNYIESREALALIEAHQQGLKILFVNHIPEIVVNDDAALCSAIRFQLKQMRAISLDNLASYLWKNQIYDIKLTQKEKDLVYYHYDAGQQIYFFFNTSLHHTIDTAVLLPRGHYFAQDVWKQCAYSVLEQTVDEHTLVAIKLRPYESLLLCSSDSERFMETQLPDDDTHMNLLDISRDWMFAKVPANNYPHFESFSAMESLQPVSDTAPQFSGVMRYEKEISLPSEAAKVLFCPQYIYEAAEVFVNSTSAGKRLTPAYQWDITKFLQKGKNHIAVEVVNTPTRDTLKNPGIFGPDREILEPSGMFGEIVIKWY